MPPFDMQRWERTLRSRNVDQILDLFSDDVTMHAESMPVPLRGKETLRAVLDESLPAIETVDFSPRKVIQSGNDLAALVHARTTYNRDYSVGGVKLPTEGKTVETDVAMFATLDNEGRIQELTRLRDTWHAMSQLGVSGAELDRIMRHMQQTLGGATPEEVGRMIRTH